MPERSAQMATNKIGVQSSMERRASLAGAKSSHNIFLISMTVPNAAACRLRTNNTKYGELCSLVSNLEGRRARREECLGASLSH